MGKPVRETANRVCVTAPAKINLFLEVLGKRADGFHEIQTVMQTIDLHDDLTFEKASSGLSLDVSGRAIPGSEDNLVTRAVHTLEGKTGRELPMRIQLHKRIPVGAGLGGGSSDAAATLKAVNMLYELSVTDDRLGELAAEFGSDITFFVHEGTALCTGRGERISPVPCNQTLWFVLICPDLVVSTRTVYESLTSSVTGDRKDAGHLVTKLEQGDTTEMGKLLFNRLGDAVLELHPSLQRVTDALTGKHFVGSCITGSGAAAYGLCTNREAADAAHAELTNQNLGEVFVCCNT